MPNPFCNKCALTGNTLSRVYTVASRDYCSPECPEYAKAVQQERNKNYHRLAATYLAPSTGQLQLPFSGEIWWV